jgi:quercetin dioxygenase-like cupin family protein
MNIINLAMSHHTKELFDWMGELAIIHTTGKETGGRYCMIELYATKEGSPPWHTHEREDESLYIIEGVITLYVGEDIYKLKAGDFALAPKGISHKYTVESKGAARLMFICSPAGAEELVRAAGKPVNQMKPLFPNKEEIDFESIASVAAQYGIHFDQ